MQELSQGLPERHEVVAPISTIVERRGAWLLFMPPCSPDFNPMELAFSKFKAHMKRLKPHTLDDLWKAAGRVCELFKPEKCMNSFAADGYATE